MLSLRDAHSLLSFLLPSPSSAGTLAWKLSTEKNSVHQIFDKPISKLNGLTGQILLRKAHLQGNLAPMKSADHNENHYSLHKYSPRPHLCCLHNNTHCTLQRCSQRYCFCFCLFFKNNSKQILKTDNGSIIFDPRTDQDLTEKQLIPGPSCSYSLFLCNKKCYMFANHATLLTAP